MTTENLDKELKSGLLNGIYLLYGEETYFLENSVNKIKKIFGELINGINYIVIDEKNINQLISNIETPAFGYNKKLIIVKNTGIFKRIIKNQDVNNIKDKLLTYFEENLKTINDTVCIVFIEESVDKTKLLDFLNKNGKVCNFEKVKPNDIIKKLENASNMTSEEVKNLEVELNNVILKLAKVK